MAEDPDLSRATRHLHSAGFYRVEGYSQHMYRAWKFSWLCFKCCIKAAIHGIYPGWFENTSEEIEEWLIWGRVEGGTGTTTGL